MPTELQLANDRAIGLLAQGRTTHAVAAFSEAIARFPNAVELYHNLAAALEAMGALDEAVQAYDSALLRAPRMSAAMTARASLLLRLGKVPEARAGFEAVLAIDPGSIGAHLGLYELLQIVGDVNGALAHQRLALERQRLYSHVAPEAERSVLVLCTPGDWQANVPVDFLFDGRTTSLHKLYMTGEDDTDLALPAYDVLFNAIAESETSAPVLQRAQAFADAQHRRLRNRSAAVAATGRTRLAATLAAVDATVTPVARVDRECVAQGKLPFGFPAIVRPVGSHAGHGLARLDTPGELPTYLEANDAAEFYASPYIDYRSPDGYYRKYRIVYVDGEPFPVHLAISPNWMIHYYNAPMAEHAWMRDEEAAFLADWRSHFTDALQDAVRATGPALGLDYVGIDAAIGPDGRLLIFEADPAMLVHTSDPADLYPYKHAFVPRIFRALEQMIDRGKGADT